MINAGGKVKSKEKICNKKENYEKKRAKGGRKK